MANEDTSTEGKMGAEFVNGLLSVQLVSSKIPHNIIFTNKGHTVYCIPRSGMNQHLSWIDICGYTRYKTTNMNKSHQYDISIDTATFENIGHTLKSAIQSKYK